MRKILVSFLLSSFGYLNLQAENLDGTVSIKYRDSNVVFRKHEAATGFVMLNNGFTIMPDRDADVTFNVPFPIRNGMDLRDTATLTLDGDLYLDSNFTISSSGNISGLGKAIFLGGDLTISDTSYVRVIHIRSDTIIDGNGHNLILGNRCKLFVDDNVTLTLRNLIIKPTYNPITDPCIRLASHRSKLALDNVNFNMQNDFDFRDGQMFIYNDVVFSGTNAFLYHSTQPSFITKNSKLCFDQDTTLLINPATFTDCNFQVKNTYTSNGFIRMEDETSQIYFNNCSLNTTLTGCKFTKGTINFDNKVNINSQVASDISSVSQVGGDAATGTSPRSLSWSPDGRFVCVVNNSSNTLQIFKFDGLSTPTKVGDDAMTGANPYSVCWSPDGRFIAVVNNDSNTLQVFRFDGSSTPIQVGGDAMTETSPRSISWSPDGRFISVVSLDSNILQVFSFNGTSTPVQVVSVGSENNSFSVSWSPDGKFIGVSISGSVDILQVFRFDGISTLTQVGDDVETGPNPRSISWSPDSRFISVVNYTPNTLKIFRFNGSSTPIQVGGGAMTETAPRSTSWSPDGRFISVVNLASNSLQIFRFDGSSTPIQVGGGISTGTNPYSVSWSPDGRFISVVNNTSNSLQIFGVTYAYDPATQALSNSVFFKDLNGIEPETNVNVLAGAQVKLDGLICV